MLNAFPDIGLVSQKKNKTKQNKNKKQKKKKKSLNRRSGTLASLLCSLETTRYEPRNQYGGKVG